MMLSAAYIAGFFDGEGCIGIYKNGKQSHHLRIQLVQNKSAKVTEAFILLQAHFGGSFKGHNSPNGRQRYNWQLNSDKAVAFLQMILPHLIIKRQQAEFALAWHKSRPSLKRDAKGRMTTHAPEQKAFDEKVATLLSALKKDDIDQVMENQKDLVEVVHTLKQVLCVKGK